MHSTGMAPCHPAAVRCAKVRRLRRRLSSARPRRPDQRFCRNLPLAVRMLAPLTGVIARLDRATQYSGLAVIHANAGDYWVPAFAGMTNLCAATTRPSYSQADMGPGVPRDDRS